VTANVFSHSASIPSSDINIDAEVWGAFRVRNGTRLLAAIDNFETVQLVIPEPTSLALAALVAAGLMSIRRRRAGDKKGSERNGINIRLSCG
jgi:hypothetical protein